ncbi:tRNA-splicing endonuclease subunit Sen2 [Homalodisca vitripennis]|nr:tRNA-splicing endonuclease subunit Sen2 [Homalodisca vitripennis]
MTTVFTQIKHTWLEMELREPKRKRVGNHIKPQQPFPILIESESGIPVDSDLWPVYIGNFTGDCVIICNPEEMKSLYTMGFFGKGSLSRGYPSFGLIKKGIPPIIKERQWQRRKSWIDKMKKNLSDTFKQVNDITNTSGDVYEGEKSGEQIKLGTNDVSPMDVDSTISESCVVKECDVQNSDSDVKDSDIPDSDAHPDKLKDMNVRDCEVTEFDFTDKVLVLADSDDDDIEKVLRDPQPHIEDEKIKTVVETLNLTLEEAFFLSYALGCLQVIDLSGQTMSLKKMWHTFCQIKPDFIESYVAYHHFRAKGWVVKSGFKFGGNFLLYKQGPPFFHASYVVLVERVDSQLNRYNDSLTWTKLHGLNRLAENSGKDIITCQVVFPDSLAPEDLITPKSLAKFQVNELLTKRWISSQERVEKEFS